MKLFASIAMLALALGLTGSAAAQDNPRKSGNRAARMQQFHTDLETAIANSTLTAEQKDTLRKDFDTVRQGRKSNDAAQKEAARTAWQNIRNTLQSDAIRPEDREKLQANMKQMRKHGGKKHNRGIASPNA